ncbi:MAG: MarR family transcriptional regulator [Desulfobacteraceae bacterium]|nr:MarR family transcriptional regulator [Desulfobacteraceae bacterium]
MEKLKGICGKVAESCMGMRVRRAARVVANHYDKHLKPTGLKGTQFTLLNTIFMNPAASIGQLADVLGLDRTTLNRNLKPLEGKGLISSGSGKDPRTRTLKMTSAGTKMLQNALPYWLEAQSGVLETVDHRIQRLMDDLSEIEKLGKLI